MKTKNAKQKKLIQYACFYTLATLGLNSFHGNRRGRRPVQPNAPL